MSSNNFYAEDRHRCMPAWIWQTQVTLRPAISSISVRLLEKSQVLLNCLVSIYEESLRGRSKLMSPSRLDLGTHASVTTLAGVKAFSFSFFLHGTEEWSQSLHLQASVPPLSSCYKFWVGGVDDSVSYTIQAVLKVTLNS